MSTTNQTGIHPKPDYILATLVHPKPSKIVTPDAHKSQEDMHIIVVEDANTNTAARISEGTRIIAMGGVPFQYKRKMYSLLPCNAVMCWFDPEPSAPAEEAPLFRLN